METQQQRGMGKIQRSYKTSLLKQQNKNKQLPRSRKGNKKHNEEHNGNKKNQNRQDQTNQQPYDKGKKKYNETPQKRIPKNLQYRNRWTKGPSKRSLHEKPEGTPLWNRKGWNKKKIEERLNSLHEKAKINPNTIWEARKRSKGCKTLEYNTYTEDGTPISDPQETKEHIANYFEQLYQAREGTTEYTEWTNKITKYVKNKI